MTDPAGITAWAAREIVAAVAGRRISAAEVMQACLDRVDAVNGLVNAVCTINPNALASARLADARLRAGGAARPLEGVPVLVKDNIETAGLRTTFGSVLYRDHVPDTDAIAVARLKDAGAIVLGKTNTPDFAADVNTTNALFGTTRNPWDLGATPGGSSGGTAAGLAAGMAPVGLGTDLGGSIRIPAAFTGLVGLRPSLGRVPVFSADYAWDTLVSHVHGPMARTVADAGLLLQVIAGADDRDPASLPDAPHSYAHASAGSVPVAGRRIAVSMDLGGLVPLDPEVKACAERAIQRLSKLGCVVETVDFDASDLMEIISGTRAYTMVARHAERYASARDDMPLALTRQVGAALDVDGQTIARAERSRTAYWHRTRHLLERYDHIVTPTVGTAAFRLDEPLPSQVGGTPVARYYDVFLAVYAFSVLGLPAISVPSGFTTSGLPAGLQIVGRRQQDHAVLELAAAYAAAAPDCFRRPVISEGSTPPELQLFDMPGMLSSDDRRSTDPRPPSHRP